MQEKEKYQMIQDKISGCVFAGALGDALGYVVEFDLYSSIKNKYGKDGIRICCGRERKRSFRMIHR